MVGIKMRAPTDAPLALETEVTNAWLGEGFDLASVRHLGEGTRRPLRTLVSEMRIERVRDERAEAGEQAPSVRVYFVLPKGAYATTVLEAAFALEETPHAQTEPDHAADREGNDPAPEPG
jgi:tRNA(Glu) U13 pseudouridine synthase TruD